MASCKDPDLKFGPLEVTERLLQICEMDGFPLMLFLSSNLDLALYLDSLGFDVYALSNNQSAIDFSGSTVNMLPSGDKSHCSQTGH